METASPFAVLTAMITPAVLISASGTLVFSTGNRLSRVVDRVRNLQEQMERPETEVGRLTADKRALVVDQLERLSRRVLLLRSAMTCFYVAIGLFVTTSLAVGIASLLGGRYAWPAVVLGLAGAAALLYGSVLLISEARQAVAATLLEMRYVSELIDRHRNDGGPSGAPPAPRAQP
jgi:hypothetical protein